MIFVQKFSSFQRRFVKNFKKFDEKNDSKAIYSIAIEINRTFGTGKAIAFLEKIPGFSGKISQCNLPKNSFSIALNSSKESKSDEETLLGLLESTNEITPIHSTAILNSFSANKISYSPRLLQLLLRLKNLDLESVRHFYAQLMQLQNIDFQLFSRFQQILFEKKQESLATNLFFKVLQDSSCSKLKLQCFSLAISNLIQNNHYIAASSLYSQVVPLLIPTNEIIFMLLKAEVELKNNLGIQFWLDEFIKFDIPLTNEIFLVLLWHYISIDDFENSAKYCGLLICSEFEFSYESFLKLFRFFSHGNFDNCDFLVKFYAFFKRREFSSIDIIAFSKVIETILENRFLTRPFINELLEDAILKKVVCSNVFDKLMMWHLDHENNESLHVILKYLKSNSTAVSIQSCNLMHRWLKEIHSPYEINTLIDIIISMSYSDTMPTYETIAIMMKFYSKQKLHDTVLDLYDQIFIIGYKPCFDVMCIAMTAYFKTGRFKAVDDLFLQIQGNPSHLKPSIINLAIDSYLQVKDIEKARLLLRDIQARTDSEDTDIYSCLFRGYSKLRLMDEAEKTLAEMNRLNIRPRIQDLTRMMDFYQMMKKNEDCIRLSALQSRFNLRPNLKFYRILIYSYLRMGQNEKATEILDKIPNLLGYYHEESDEILEMYDKLTIVVMRNRITSNLKQ